MELRKRRRRFTVDEYLRMGESGILGRDDRLELIRGELIQMSPIGIEHGGRLVRLIRLLSTRIEGRAVLSPQNPLSILPHSMPQPDLMLLRPHPDDYCSAYPTPADVLIVIEIADSSLSWDRRVKGKLYSEFGISEYWIVNLRAKVIEVHTSPEVEGYKLVRKLRADDPLDSPALPGLGLTVAEILG